MNENQPDTLHDVALVALLLLLLMVPILPLLIWANNLITWLFRPRRHA
ncbi:hypothetical protein [Fibrella aquatilis]|uniref:Uncharacterized protein n=1 Tax=Fibrella aquatilis TaxID=2817059 RepID=A0A939G1L1_9BACT|nr:hypothetical protein [Fibrella aquatilis]MBO0930334.1 hypothetical protein [Fibrella aquatilis]